jgi:hypothetical protein
MTVKREIPTWSVVAAVVACLALVGALYIKGANGGEASRDELMQIRGNQQRFSYSPSNSTPR